MLDEAQEEISKIQKGLLKVKKFQTGPVNDCLAHTALGYQKKAQESDSQSMERWFLQFYAEMVLKEQLENPSKMSDVFVYWMTVDKNVI